MNTIDPTDGTRVSSAKVRTRVAKDVLANQNFLMFRGTSSRH